MHELTAKELEVLAMQQEISSQAKGEMDRSQREFFLRQQLKAIQSELGEGNELSEEIVQLRDKAHKAKMPKPVLEEVERQLKKLERMHPDSAETATLRNWLDWMVTLPWGKSTKDNLDLAEAQKILDEDHYGLEKVKERIVEYLAVRKLKDKMKGPLLCFVGPPGVVRRTKCRSNTASDFAIAGSSSTNSGAGAVSAFSSSSSSPVRPAPVRPNGPRLSRKASRTWSMKRDQFW